MRVKVSFHSPAALYPTFPLLNMLLDSPEDPIHRSASTRVSLHYSTSRSPMFLLVQILWDGPHPLKRRYASILMNFHRFTALYPMFLLVQMVSVGHFDLAQRYSSMRVSFHPFVALPPIFLLVWTTFDGPYDLRHRCGSVFSLHGSHSDVLCPLDAFERSPKARPRCTIMPMAFILLLRISDVAFVWVLVGWGDNLCFMDGVENDVSVNFFALVFVD